MKYFYYLYLFIFMDKNIDYSDGYPSKSNVNYDYVEKLKTYNINRKFRHISKV